MAAGTSLPGGGRVGHGTIPGAEGKSQEGLPWPRAGLGKVSFCLPCRLGDFGSQRPLEAGAGINYPSQPWPGVRVLGRVPGL